MVATSKSPSIHKNTVYQKRDFFMESLFFCKKTNFRLLCHTVFIEIKEAKQMANDQEIRAIVAGSRNFVNYNQLEKECDKILSSEIKKAPVSDVTIISGGASGADKLGEKYGKKRHLSIVRFEANWDRFQNAAGPIRNEKMAKYAAEVDRKMLIAFWDGQSKGTGSMIDLAKKHGIEVHVVNI